MKKLLILLAAPILVFITIALTARNIEIDPALTTQGTTETQRNVSIRLSSQAPLTVSDSISPSDDLFLPFGTVTEGRSIEQFIRISNQGNKKRSLLSIAEMPLSSPFSLIWDQCSGMSLAPAESCLLRIQFKPNKSLQTRDRFEIVSDDPAHPIIWINLAGKGISEKVPNIGIRDSAGLSNDLKIGFGRVSAGRSAEHTVTLSNDGSERLIIGALTVPDPLTSPFAIVKDRCSGRALSVRATCEVKIAFTPEGEGMSSEKLEVSSNDPDGMLTIRLSGRGLNPSANNAPSQPKLISPVDGRDGEQATLRFVWASVIDPDGDSVDYDFFLCEDPIPFTCAAIPNTTELAILFTPGFLFAGVFSFSFLGRGHRKPKALPLLLLFIGITLISCGSSENSSTGEPGNQSQVLKNLSPKTQYYWAVVSKDDKGGRTRSEVWAFSTQ